MRDTSSGSGKLKIGYLVHDVSDTAVNRRVGMFLAGGAEVEVFGFRRCDQVQTTLSGCLVHDLGQTRDGDLKHRALSVVRQGLRARKWGQALKSCDVIVARSLEMMALAIMALTIVGPKVSLVYECVDIHRIMTSPKPAGRVMRWLERKFLVQASLLITSSPGFVSHYFRAVQNARTQTLIVENKPLEAQTFAVPSRNTRPSNRPWTIGWFGVIRCKQSLDILSALTQRLPGQVEVIIAGKIAQGVFEDFTGAVAAAPGISFLGPYRPTDLASLYDRVDFTWAIDFFESGGNSDWLLPNRLYEGGAFGSVPIAMADVETGRWTAEKGLGIQLSKNIPEELVTIFEVMMPSDYALLRAAAVNAPRETFVAGAKECADLVSALVRLETLNG
jgi:hypothetical protein